VHIEHSRLHPSIQTIAHWKHLLGVQKNGIILAGSDNRDHSAMIFALAERLQWPIFADVLSPLRACRNHPSLIPHFDPILKVNPHLSSEAIIQFGDRFTSKTLTGWLEQQALEFFLHVSDHPDRQDPSHLITHRLLACPGIFTEELLLQLEDPDNSAWLSSWKGWDHACREALQDFFSSSTELTEPGVVWEIASFLSGEWALFLANSMPIRDANQFFASFPDRCGPIFGNRGVSGIDGNIATAAGIAEGCKKPTLALMGDLTFLHDLNSLPWLRQPGYPVVLCVINNGGGGIFSFLPVAKRKEAFEEMIATSHNDSFRAAAALFNLPYHHPQSPEEFEELLVCQKKQPHSCLIEITTERSNNVLIHEQILKLLRSCLSSPVETPVSLH
jgi:2-succinyl-5-enolpyruvyl-6-hydroxy-3-cyclohexene-1-carboxylate synthase